MALVLEPDIYNLTNEEYHADPVPGGSISSSGAQLLTPPSPPAIYKAYIDAGEEHKRHYDVGQAAHAIVLGTGAPLHVIPAENYTLKKTREERDEAYAAGEVPVLANEYGTIIAMADALRAHPTASALLQPGTGLAEQSIFWVDEETEVWRRAMIDWMCDLDENGRRVCVDYKTAAKRVNPLHLAKSMYDFGYFQQAPWYLDGIMALELSIVEPAFVFIFQEKDPPHLVSIAQPDPDMMRWGRILNRKAIDVYRVCSERDEWPGYTEEIVSVSLPTWAEYQLNANFDNGIYDTWKDKE